MKPIKLNVKTKTENYQIIIGSNIIKDLTFYLKKNSIDFQKSLLVIDKRVPKKMISKIQNAGFKIQTKEHYNDMGFLIARK